MNYASTPNNNLKNPEMQFDGDSKKAPRTSLVHSVARFVYSLETASNRSLFMSRLDGQVREEKGAYSPDSLPGAKQDNSPRSYSAIADHAKHLHKVESTIDDASNLVGLMLASLDDESDGRAMQTIAGLKVVEKKLIKAHDQIDRHHTCHRNLLTAYLDLKKPTDSGD